MKDYSNSHKMKPKALLGLSGGVDSAVAAHLLQKQGYEVIAAFLKCFSDTKDPLTNECGWRQEKQSAQKIAAKLKIPLITIDLEKQYKKQVIEPMYKSYAKNLTPNPDIACNTIIKFPWLRKAAKKHKCQYISTGHYARIKRINKKEDLQLMRRFCKAKSSSLGGRAGGKSSNKGYQLLMGKDKTKDQSYFLSELTQTDLAKTIFPIGNLTKTQVREIAKSQRFHNYDKKSTRGICFVGKVNMQKFLQKQLKPSKGNIKDTQGNIIGTHPGTQYFTIGQRIGPRLNMTINKQHAQKKYFIAKKFKSTNTIIAVPEHHRLLKQTKIKIIKLKKINPKQPLPKQLSARIRHLGKLYFGKLSIIWVVKQVSSASKKSIRTNLLKGSPSRRTKQYIFTLNKPQKDIAPGQQIALYKNQQLLASGEIRL